MGIFDSIKSFFGTGIDGELPKEDYIEIDLKNDLGKKAKIIARPFILREFNDVDKILDSLREGYTIALIDIKLLKSKDLVELKRAISKIKKTTDAIGGEIAGFGENLVIVAPSFVRIYKGEKTTSVEAVERKSSY